MLRGSTAVAQSLHDGIGGCANTAGNVAEAFGLALFEAIPLPTMVFDRDSLEFLAVNEAAVDMYGYSRGDFSGMTVREIRPPEVADTAVKLIKTLPDGQYPPIRAEHQRRDGRTTRVDVASRSLIVGPRHARVAIVSDTAARLRSVHLHKATEQLHEVDVLRQRLVHRMKDPVIPEVAQLIGAIADGVGNACRELKRAIDSLPRESPSVSMLSGREREILVLISRGLTNQQVGDRLALSVKTIETYRRRLMAKLGLVGRADLVRYALESGLLQPNR